jgi:hypothetical protein
VSRSVLGPSVAADEELTTAPAWADPEIQLTRMREPKSGEAVDSA